MFDYEFTTAATLKSFGDKKDYTYTAFGNMTIKRCALYGLILYLCIICLMKGK